MSNIDKAGPTILDTIMEAERKKALDAGRPTFDRFVQEVRSSNVPEEALLATNNEISRALPKARAGLDNLNNNSTIYSDMAEKILEHKFETEVEALYAIQYILAAGSVKQQQRLELEMMTAKKGVVSIFESSAMQVNMETSQLFNFLKQFTEQFPQLEAMLKYNSVEEYMAAESPEMGMMREASIINYGMMLMIRERDEKRLGVIDVILGDIQRLAGNKKDKFGDAVRVVEEYFKDPTKKNRMLLMAGMGK